MSRRCFWLRGLVGGAILLAAVPASAQDQSALVANQELRIQQLEGQIRALNGELEQMSHQVRQMTDRLDKLVADIDFRLREVEGSDQGMSMGEAAPAGEEPSSLAAAPPASGGDLSQPTAGQSGTNQSGTDQSGVGQPRVLGTMSQSQLDSQKQRLNPNADPAAAAAAAGGAGSSAAPGAQTAATGPYVLEGATADEQYQYAFDLLRQNKYGDAEQALRTFVDQYPEHPLAGNASYWLGETFYVRQDYDNAALTFAEGFQKYPQGGKAPDSLLKLGMSLAALGETGDACKAFGELAARYPKASEGIKQRAAREQSKNGCQ
ncbi:MAG: tol-pal system protein YbgF [Dongiaceae bacterium]